MAAGGNQQRLAIRIENPEDRVAAIMAEHGRTLLRAARHWSMCRDDALDAYQRGLEIFLRRAESVDPATEVAWLKVVIKHEAMAIRRSRQESVGGDEIDFDAQAPAAQRSVEEQIVSGERVSRSAEALRALKPDEARALMLKAEGLSYQEIGERCGWTYTKVNRAITEGRRRFMKVYAGIESGQECDRFGPVLAALADGTASSADVVAIRPHLRHCTACRATVRELHISRRRRIKLLIPLPLPALFGHRLFASEPNPSNSIPRLQDVLETTAATGGRFDRLRPLHDFFHRLNSSDLAASVHIASTGGGGRVASFAAVVGFCLSGLGAGAVCVVTGLVPEFQSGGPRTERKADANNTSRAHLASDPDHAVAKAPSGPLPELRVTNGRRAELPKRPALQSPRRPRRFSKASTEEPSKEARAESAQTAEFGFEHPAPPSSARASASSVDPPSTPPAVTGRDTIDPAQQEFGP